MKFFGYIYKYGWATARGIGGKKIIIIRRGEQEI